jgi:mannose-6-phosphate isomerase-like protein (cupin superfamily)
MDDYDVPLVRTHGEFTWHSHPDTDELFLVLQGSLTIRLEDDDEVVLDPGQLYVVPKGRHQPERQVVSSRRAPRPTDG